MAASGLVLKPAALDSIHLGGISSHGCLEPVEAIQIYLATLGSNLMIPLSILSCDTIASIKLRIQAYKGFYVKQQRLVYGGRELTKDDSLIKDYGVSNGEILHLVIRLSSILDVAIKTCSGREYLLRVKRTKSVKDLKQLISEEEDGLAIEDQQLILRGEELDNQRILDELSLEDKTVVHLLVAKSAKVRTKFTGKNVEISVTAVNKWNGTISSKDDTFLPSVCMKLDSNPLRRSGSMPLDLPYSGSNYENCDGQLPTFPLQKFEGSRILEPARELLTFQIPHVLIRILDRIKAGMNRGHKPVLASGGSGGTYFMQDEDGSTSVAIFKPMDEEPMAANNPRGMSLSLTGEGLKKGIRVGEGALREVAAYILDHPVQGPRIHSGINNRGFAGVPATMMAYCYHEAFNYSGSLGVPRRAKIGSLQQFVNSISDCEDMGPANFPVEEVHKITVLDMRFANTDRNGGNILVCKESESLKLVPIDHGYCFPETFEDCTFEWLYWPQARVPYQATTLKYIASLDAEKDIALLHGHGWDIPPKCARVLRVATMLLKKGAAAGLSPFFIGSMMCRDYMNRKSTIERMLEDAEANIWPGSSDVQFLESLSVIMDSYVDEASSYC
ncbi:hypothetical protein O6H91_20G065300 [Diphasiastrum complanatum]|uniref:Uncharacterized protein n=2 Tax=Diphasiastrum complanatum TaxID=34168 RepID=A0ACC2AR95_DIPCM|nr:hypothetical protein O6H91_20G065300 [Diphasiastrum complanatum]